MAKTIKCVLQTLAPVHVGCDEVYEPTGFVVDEPRSKLVVFDPMKLLSQMSAKDREQFSRYCREGTVTSILQIYKFLEGRHASGREIDLCNGFFAHYRKTLGLSTSRERDIQQELNRFQIARTAFAPYDQRPFIPGSSIKGAIRTGYLNTSQERKKLPKGVTARAKAPHSDLEKRLLVYDEIETDPFRLLKVSDFMPVGAVRTRVAYAINQVKRDPEKTGRGPKQLIEVVEAGQLFVGTIRVDAPQRGAPIKRPLTFEDLWSGTTRFFAKEKDREDSELGDLRIPVATTPKMDGGALLRVGRHSGAECVTIEGHRSIKILGSKGQTPSTKDHATTLWLVSEHRDPMDKTTLRPMGWILLKMLSSEEERKIEAEEMQWDDGTGAKPASREGPNVVPAHQLEMEAPSSSPDSVVEVWDQAFISWSAGSATVTAKWQGKSATGRGSDLIPAALMARLKKKKPVCALVSVEVRGTDYFWITAVEEI